MCWNGNWSIEQLSERLLKEEWKHIWMSSFSMFICVARVWLCWFCDKCWVNKLMSINVFDMCSVNDCLHNYILSCLAEKILLVNVYNCLYWQKKKKKKEKKKKSFCCFALVWGTNNKQKELISAHIKHHMNTPTKAWIIYFNSELTCKQIQDA